MPHTDPTPLPVFVPLVTLEGWGIRLEPLGLQHLQGLQVAALDEAQYQLLVTWVPHPTETMNYIQQALHAQAQGQRCPFAVIDSLSDKIIGTTSYCEIVPAVQRLEIGHTWYAASAQRTHANTAAKLLLMHHAFDTLGCAVVGWRTDALNHRSQKAIERLGAHKDGVLRHHQLRRDASVRDTVMYSMLAHEWPHARQRLIEKLEQHASALPSAECHSAFKPV